MSLNVITVKLQFLLNLNLRGISFHAVVVFGLDKNFLFKSILGHCETLGNSVDNQANIMVMASEDL